MDRPTCATCPYWHDYVMGNGFGQCRRMPPVFQVSSDTEDPNGFFPESLALHFCGEHPDFTAFIESRKAGTKCPTQYVQPPNDVAAFDEAFSSERIVVSHVGARTANILFSAMHWKGSSNARRILDMTPIEFLELPNCGLLTTKRIRAFLQSLKCDLKYDGDWEWHYTAPDCLHVPATPPTSEPSPPPTPRE